MRIGLYGISGTYNYGCEAIVRGAYKFFTEAYPNSEMVYFSFCPAYDKMRLKDLNITVIKMHRKVRLYKRIINKVLNFLGYERQLLMVDTDIIVQNVDILVSVGGDLYTIPKVLREKSKYPYHNELVDIAACCHRNGKKTVIYGASIGPFGAYKRALDYYIKSLSSTDLIICREKETINYLLSLGIKNNVVFSPDPAFWVGEVTDIVDYSSNEYIGLNISELSLWETKGSIDNDRIGRIIVFIKSILESTGAPILFLPHVVYGDTYRDNDDLFMRSLLDAMPEEMKTHIEVADPSGGFLGIKKQIREKCAIVISARMHCAVNAVRESIPTIFLSYSTKAKGMCTFVYGNDSFTTDVNNLDDNLVRKVNQLYTSRGDISSQLRKRNDEIQSLFADSINLMRSVL